MNLWSQLLVKHLYVDRNVIKEVYDPCHEDNQQQHHDHRIKSRPSLMSVYFTLRSFIKHKLTTDSSQKKSSPSLSKSPLDSQNVEEEKLPCFATFSNHGYNIAEGFNTQLFSRYFHEIDYDPCGMGDYIGERRVFVHEPFHMSDEDHDIRISLNSGEMIRFRIYALSFQEEFQEYYQSMIQKLSGMIFIRNLPKEVMLNETRIIESELSTLKILMKQEFKSPLVTIGLHTQHEQRDTIFKILYKMVHEKKYFGECRVDVTQCNLYEHDQVERTMIHALGRYRLHQLDTNQLFMDLINNKLKLEWNKKDKNHCQTM
nr:unnamed protein product [Naegleria fowleri]